MEYSSTKLLQQVPQLNFFEDNQVLSAAQLNNNVNYFDFYQRLTKACLIGTGVVCGLEVQNSKEFIVISRGCGITSDGDLVYIPSDKKFIYVSRFEDNKGKYGLFNNPDNPITLWQLHELKPQDESADKIQSFFTGNRSILDYVVLVYLEEYLLDKDICTSDDCDNMGLVQKSELKVLLISKNDVSKIRKENVCCSDVYFDMPPLTLKRVIFNPTGTFSSGDLYAAYNSPVEGIMPDLEKALAISQKVYGALLSCRESFGSSKNLPSTDGKLIDKVNSAWSGIKNKIGVQYAYDFIKDITCAYNSFKESVYELCTSCCPSPELYPKHLLLGELITSDAYRTRKFRQCFAPSPVLGKGNIMIEKAVFIYKRLVDIINNFKFRVNVKEDIRITPSAGIGSELGEQAIPYYYDTKVIYEDWSYEKMKRNKAKAINSYSASGYSNLPQTLNPLVFDLDEYQFFRIEGHIGKTYETAFSSIRRLIEQFDLPFDVTGVQLQNDRKTVIPKTIPKLNHLDTLIDIHTSILKDHLFQLKNYNNELVKKIPEDVTSLPEFKQDTNTRYGNVVSIRTEISGKKSDIDQHIDTAIAILDKKSSEPLVERYAKIADSASVLNMDSNLFTKNNLLTPLANIPVFAPILDWLKDNKKEAEDVSRESYIFTNFLKEHPALLHNCGVPRGGTFVLVYETVNNVRTVVADFYLPYICCDEIEKPPITMKPFIPVSFVPYNKVIELDYLKSPLFNKDVSDLNTKLSLNISDLNQKFNLDVSDMKKNLEKLNVSDIKLELYKDLTQKFSEIDSIKGQISANNTITSNLQQNFSSFIAKLPK
jgi:hypothetical protein